METVYFNGQFMPREQVAISPDDRGFLFGDSVYEVVRWYGGYFFDMEGHMSRLQRSLKETRIVWEGLGTFPEIAKELVHLNDLGDGCSLVYLQVTRGAAPRMHAFPEPPVAPTVFASVRRQSMDTLLWERGVTVDLVPDPRWNRCDIKTTALLANILAYQNAHDAGHAEVCFVLDGFLTEGAHSNMFFVKNDTIYTHPESTHILSGITRKNVIAIAAANDIPLIEEALSESMLPYIHEAFLTNTSGEILPVLKIGSQQISEGLPGAVTRKLQGLFRERVMACSR
ncbi:MAG TPA: aminotransferase class IV [Bacteroidales bacterium]|nr:aminotransferase class IV [Bacteroidales bacterium]